MNSGAARIRLFLLILVASAFALSGCNSRVSDALLSNVVVSNTTPGTLPENPSGIYTFVVSVRPMTVALLEESLEVNISIDGRTFPMKRSGLAQHLWEYDHPIARGRSEASYFFTVDYLIQGREGRRLKREAFTPLQTVRIVNKYSLGLEAQRAPVGATIAIIGRGFEEGDSVMVGGTAAQTRFLSPNSVQFTMPALEADQNYPVVLLSRGTEYPIGHIRVDRATLSVAPQSLTLRSKERQSIRFTLPTASPPSGLRIHVTTDVPASVIMEEVIVPAGSSSVTIPVIGGTPGSGTIFIEAPGFDPVNLPITVL